MQTLVRTALTCVLGMTMASVSVAQEAVSVAQEADLAKKLSNPLAAMISVPFQFNSDTGYGSANGNQTTLNIQPVIPYALTDDLNLITRIIIPYKW
jgi:hypothetical protein